MCNLKVSSKNYHEWNLKHSDLCCVIPAVVSITVNAYVCIYQVLSNNDIKQFNIIV